MPRSRGGGGRSAPSGSRSSSTVAASPAAVSRPAPPPAKSQAQSQAGQPRQPGLLGQMAATAGSVAVGSTIGHGISSMLFGGRGEAAAPTANAQTAAPECSFQAKEFTKCLDAADVQTCQWFLDQLKGCQAAASQYGQQ